MAIKRSTKCDCDTRNARRAFVNQSAILDTETVIARANGRTRGTRSEAERSGAEPGRAGFSARSAEESIDGQGMVCDAIARHRVRSPYLYPTRGTLALILTTYFNDDESIARDGDA